MDSSLFARGLILGCSIAAPVGPIGVLCIRRTLAYGRLAGLLSGLGAATADGIYGCIAAFGLTLITNFLVDQAFWLRLMGGLFLCYLGVQTVRSKPALSTLTTTNLTESSVIAADVTVAGDRAAAPASVSPSPAPPTATSKSLFALYASTVLLTLTNPMTILSFAAVFAGLGLATAGGNYGDAALLVTGVFIGSALWWLCLSALVNLFRSHLNFRRLRSLNQISGVVLLAFGVIALAGMFAER